MSGLEPIPQRNEEEVLERMLKDRSILELEDRLGIKIPTSKDQSEEDLINRILEMTGRPISKRGDEFVYAPTRPNFGRDDGLSFYVNPKINGAGIRYSKNFADGGIASFADGGSLNRKGGGIVKLQEGGEPDTIFEPDLIKYSDEGPLSFRDVSDLIFDPTDPVDYAVLALMATGVGAPAAIAIKLARAGVKGTKLINTMNKVEKVNKFKKVEKPRDILTNTAKLGAANYLTDEMNPVSYEKMDVLLSDKIRNDPNYQDLMMSDQDAMIPKSIDLLNRPEEKADGGIAGFAEGGRVGKVSKLYTKIKDKFKKKKDTKKEKEITDKKPDPPISKTQILKEELMLPVTFGKNILSKIDGDRATRGLVRSTLYPGVGTGLYFGGKALFGDDEDSETKTTTITPEESTEVETSDRLGDILRQKTMTIAAESGRATPVFFDYVKAFPSSYMEKVGRDPEFAKQMMAGFLAMMKPVAGPVPVNPFVAFGEAAMAEGVRQEGEIPDQLKLIETISQDPELLKAYREFQRKSDPPSVTEKQANAAALENIVKEELYGPNFDDKDKVVDADGNQLSKNKLLEMYYDSGENLGVLLKKVAASDD